MIILAFGAVLLWWAHRDPRVWPKRRRPLLGLTGVVGIATYVLVESATSAVWALYIAQFAVIGYILALRGRASGG